MSVPSVLEFIGMVTVILLGVSALVGCIHFAAWLPRHIEDVKKAKANTLALTQRDEAVRKAHGLQLELDGANLEIERLKTAGPYRGVT